MKSVYKVYILLLGFFLSSFDKKIYILCLMQNVVIFKILFYKKRFEILYKSKENNFVRNYSSKYCHNFLLIYRF